MPTREQRLALIGGIHQHRRVLRVPILREEARQVKRGGAEPSLARQAGGLPGTRQNGDDGRLKRDHFKS
jgi:hypothetical protein